MNPFVRMAIVIPVMIATGLFQDGTARAASIVNGGFESGNFRGWATIGIANIQTAAIGIAPTRGTFQALLTTGTGSAAVTDLESFLTLPAGTLSGLGNGTVIDGSAIKQTLSLAAGAPISFDADFLTNESPGPANRLDDFGFFSVSGPVGSTARTLASVQTPGLSSAPPQHRVRVPVAVFVVCPICGPDSRDLHDRIRSRGRRSVCGSNLRTLARQRLRPGARRPDAPGHRHRGRARLRPCHRRGPLPEPFDGIHVWEVGKPLKRILVLSRRSEVGTVPGSTAGLATGSEFSELVSSVSSGDTIPNCLGEFREIRESKQRTGIAPIRQARLERLALSASGHERMVKGPTAASKEQRIDFSAGIAWFGDILNIDNDPPKG